MTVLESFSPATRAWFEASFEAPTGAQEFGWPAIAKGEHTLIHAPTGSGKTLAAFLWTLDRLMHEPVPPDRERCRVLYVSPLKALAYDVERNLRAPLAGIRHAAAREGLDDPVPITTAMRTGDTPAEERRRMIRRPPDILITTPESLYLMVTSQVREVLASVRWVIVDEVHAVAGTKRGAHLALTLERLEALTAERPQRIGLSATQRPLETIARFLAGGVVDDEGWEPRPVTIIDVAGDKRLDVDIVVPVDDMTAPVPEDHDAGADEPATRSIWPAVYPRILEQIRAHTSTIVFANSRRLAERISAEINNLAGEEISRAHHGSVAREQRIEIEEALKRGELPCVVATSSLELGIDMGAVDLVIQVEAPSTVASGLQRVGRAGHQVGAASRATVFPKYRGDLLVSTVVVDRMLAGAVEATRLPRNPLDVLAQQVVAAVAMDDWSADDLYGLVRGAAPYADLARGPFDATLDMLAGRYPSDLFAELRPRLVWDRVTQTLTARPGAHQLAVQNPGTIPDRGLFTVNLPDGAKVGELDEEMVYESRPGDVFVLGTTTWKIADITHDRVEVIPAPGEPGARMPFWHGDLVGRPLETGRALGAFTREIAALDADDAIERLQARHRLDERAARNLRAYLDEELEASGALPTDSTIVVERFRDEIGDWRLVLLSPFGARVHAPWAMALTNRFRSRFGHDVNVIWADDGIAFRFADVDDPPTAADLLVEPDEVESLLMDQLADTALFAARFRESAARALLLPRRRPGSRTPLWLQRRRSADLLGVAKGYGSFPIMLETYREILQDDFDLPALVEVLTDIRARRIRVVEVDATTPSPFAASLLFSFVAAYLYEGDTPLAERRAAALTLDRELLRELLGEGELRELLSEEVIASVELELQHLTESRRARHPDAVHDLLRSLGPLSTEDVDVRAAGDGAEWLDLLATQRRAVEVVVAGRRRWVAVEDLARLRDALGVPPPPGVAGVFLEPVEDPLGDVVGRYARTHGPFTEEQAVAALGLPPAVVATTLERLESAGRVVRGAFRPGGQTREWVETEVLRRLKRRSLARLRREIEPVDGAAYARFVTAWHGIDEPKPRRGSGSLGDVVGQIQGAAVPASTLERDVLASRMDYSPDLLDALMLSGDVVWAGRGALGTRDGRLALYWRDAFPRLWLPGEDPPDGPLHDALRRHLDERGASFFPALYEAAGGGDPQTVLDALWDLVWAGAVTNDTLAPVRALLGGTGRRRTGGKPRLAARFPPAASGRWSSTSDLLAGSVSETERAAAWADQVLERHGVVTRLGVATEGIPGAFSSLYPVLTRLEETGRVRRGYFVEGLGGAQFAVPGAVDRLRSDGDDRTVLLAATDPANPYGAALDWPEMEAGRPSRSAGAYVILRGGTPAAYVERGGRTVGTFGPSDPAALATELARAARRLRRLTIERCDGEPVTTTPLGPALLEAGFRTGPRGLAFRG